MLTKSSMEASVRRSTIIYLIYSLAVFAIFWRAFYSIAERTALENFFLKILLFPISVTLLIRLILKPNYIVVKDSILTICKDFFTEESFSVDKLVRIEISGTPFKNSFFVLDNHSRYEFNYFYVSDPSFKVLVEKLGKPVNDI